MNFSSDRRTVLGAFTFSIAGVSSSAAVDGRGSGTVTVGNSAWPQCRGPQFSFSLSPNV